ncbi:hypothetical protein ACHWQZ_G015242 [Mnemiopsis leidyi]
MYLYQLANNLGQMPPCHASKLGHQHDSGAYWCVLANTPHGPIPGKGRQGKAWYPYGGKEHETNNFSYIHMMPGCTLSLVRKSSPHPPPGALDLGRMMDGSVYFVVICHTGQGQIPGKAKMNTPSGPKAWYSFGGREHEHFDFSFVVAHPPQHGGFAPPPTGILTPGAVVRLTSKAHGKNLRINQNGDVDGRGGTGQWATFMVHARGPYIALSLQNHPNKFLAIKNNTLTHGTGGKFCSLIVKPNPDGTVSLESAEHRTQHVGILDNGDPKGPHHTGTGKHGQFYVN